MTTDTLTREVSRSAACSIFMGALTAVIGALMIIYPLATAAASTVFLGSALMVIGAAQAIFAFTSDSVGSFFLKLLIAILYGIAGVLLVAFPAAGPGEPDRVAGHDARCRGRRGNDHRLRCACAARAWLVRVQRDFDRAARRVDSRPVAEQLDVGDWNAGRRRRPHQRNHARGDLDCRAPRSPRDDAQSRLVKL